MQSKAEMRDEKRMATALARMERATETAKEAVRQVEMAAQKAEVAARRLQKRTGWAKRDETRRKIVLGSQLLWMRDTGDAQTTAIVGFMLSHMKGLLRDGERELLDQIGTDKPPSHQQVTQCKAALGGLLIAIARQGEDSGSFDTTDEGPMLWSHLAREIGQAAIGVLYRSHDIRLFKGWEITPNG